MRVQHFGMSASAALALFVFTTSAGAITYNVGNNPAAPDTIVVVNSSGGPLNPSFSFSAGIDHNPSADNLLKDFTNDAGGGFNSGQNVPIVETFSNDGSETWTAWDEIVVSTTTGIPQPSPGFLFDENSISVFRNGNPLTQGTDYTLVGVPYFNAGNNGYLSITISLAPGSYIQPGNTLEIHKSIHEVFSDGDPWRPEEAARVAQFPTAIPEPAAAGALLALTLAVWRNRRVGATISCS